jgi:hypothetical protein
MLSRAALTPVQETRLAGDHKEYFAAMVYRIEMGFSALEGDKI